MTNEPARSRPLRLAAVGFQGFGNLGDEAILCGLEAIFSGTGEFRTVFAGRLAPVIAAPHAERVHPARLLPTPGTLARLRRCDVLIISGGGLVNDYWPFVIPRYLAWILAARALGRRVLWAGVGVGPLKHRASRLLTRIAFWASDAVVVRDEASFGLARSLAPGANITLAADPAFALSPPKESHERRGLAIIPRQPAPGDEGRLDDVVRMVRDLVVAGAASGDVVEILLLHPAEDAALRSRLIREVDGRLPDTAIRTIQADPNEAMRELGRYKSVVSMRLHGVILAVIAGVPVAAIAYDRKVAEVARQLGIEEAVVPMDALSAERVLSVLSQPRTAARNEHLANCLGQTRERTMRLRSALVQLRL